MKTREKLMWSLIGAIGFGLLLAGLLSLGGCAETHNAPAELQTMDRSIQKIQDASEAIKQNCDNLDTLINQIK